MNGKKIESIAIDQIYKHPPDKVFDAFSRKAAFKQWIAPSDQIETNILLFDFHVGGKFRIEFSIPESGIAYLTGEYVKIDRPKLISFTWEWEKPDIHAGINSLVTAEFLEHGEHTRLKITHENLATQQATERHTQGWSGALSRLDHYLIKQSGIQG